LRAVKTKINWDYKKPKGLFEMLIGPGATGSEILLYLLAAAGSGTAIVLSNVMLRDIKWTYFQNLAAFLIAWSLAGGVVALNTSSAKRYWNSYREEGLTMLFKSKPLIVLLHLVLPLIVVLMFRPGDWSYFTLISLYLVAGAAILLLMPLYLKRPVAIALSLAGYFAEISLFEAALGIEWFAVLLFLKIFNGLMVQEEPYRPV